MGAVQLLEELALAGLTVREYNGWMTRGGSWRHALPIGLMEHHTANPVPYPLANLAGDADGRIKCNVNTKPDGTVWLVAYGACNYSSGQGSSVVKAEAERGTPPGANANTRGLRDDMGGNSYFWNFENDHQGDGRPMPAVQHQAIVMASRICADHFGLSWANTISHAEWTARKVDPYWNGDRRCIEAIRDGMAGEDTEPPTQPPQDGHTMQITRQTIRRGDDDANFGGDVYTAQGLLCAFGHDLGNSGGRGNGIDGSFGGLTDQATREFQGANGLTVDGIIGPQSWNTLERA